MNKQILEKVQRNPQLFIEKVLGVETMEKYQADICQDVADYDRVAVSACHAVGKTWLLARIVLWFLYCFPGAKIITTAPTNRQVEMLLWGEIGVAVKNALYNLGGHLTSKKLQIESDWYAMGFSPAKTAGGDENGEQKGSTFQGWHGDYILIVFDEAVGVPPDVWTQVEGLLTSGKIVKFVCIANPTTKNCNFFELFSMPSWKKVYLSCFDSPNLIMNGIVDLETLEAEVELLNGLDEGPRLDRLKNYKKPVSHLISCQWVMEKALEWGIEDARFQSKVLGLFPDVDDTVLIQGRDVELAQRRKNYPKSKRFIRYIGVDVARFGDDKSCFTELIDAEEKKLDPITVAASISTNERPGIPLPDYSAKVVHTRTKKTSKKDLMETTGDVFRFIMDDYEGEQVVVAIDATGLGSGVYDRLVEMQKSEKDDQGKPLIPRKVRFLEMHNGMGVKSIQKGKTATKKEALEQRTHHNIKSLMFDDLSKALKADLRLRKDSTYNQQLPTIKYKFMSSGKMIIESKSDYKKRTGKPSPDESDSLALANFARRFSGYGDYLRKLTR